MGTPYLSELRIFTFGFAPKGWAQCNGQLMPINQNQALFSLLGTTYGGNGQTTFGLPDLRGRVPMHMGSFTLGQVGGEEGHTLTPAEMPPHTHQANGTNTVGDQNIALGNLPANVSANLYAPPGQPQPLDPRTVSNLGGSQPHDNMTPFLTLNICIALQGVFPSRN